MDKFLEAMANGSAYGLQEILKPPKISAVKNKLLWVINEDNVLKITETYDPPYTNDFDLELY